ncbi:phosphate ABC transporter permease PstA [Hyphomicrobium sp. CS1GBMeth3]|uniref:phosphate ABC transporter permease PstA n=1 Tax=Hyphomicrobium sp. CS1GBMeth3 TaxID=1892845 RepID=UPI0009FB5C36|nr:phosphate ABC transporter permease PstA [Hyphomicrobium sp. CS1GBMeth3]
MTDTTAAPIGMQGRHDWNSADTRRRVRRRYAANRRLQIYGLGAIGFAILLLGTLFSSLIFTGYVAFTTTKVKLAVHLDAGDIDPAKPESANYRKLTRDAFLAYFPGVSGQKEQRDLQKILSSGAPYIVRDYIVANKGDIGNVATITVPLSDPYDQLYKGVIPSHIEALSSGAIERFDRLKARGVVNVDNGVGRVRLEMFINPADIPDGDVGAGDYQRMINEALQSYFPGTPFEAIRNIMSSDAATVVKERVAADPQLIGKTIAVDLPLSEHYDSLARTGKAMMLNPRFSSPKEIEWFESLKERGLLASPFSWEIFFNPDSRFPELAGLAGALTGSFLALLVCFLLSFPVGIATAFYLEEFAPKNRWSDLIEVNINNLAAVPSVVFGLLGLAVFLGAFGMPRSAPIVGGMVLSLMTLPTIIVATRAALKAVPPSIREAGYGIGASKHQVMLHHVLPLAMPGILTGTIIGLAQALGETAPLLLIGMNAFIPSIENMGLLQPATALPTQIFSWADSPERGFVSRTSAAILILLAFLITMNAIAIYLRNKVERKW